MPDNEAFFDVVKNRRSIRRFKADPVPDEYITKIIDAARWAQSGANAQPWEFIVVKDRELRNKIIDKYMECRQEQWEIEKSRIQEMRHPSMTEGLRPGPPGFKDAPVLIVVCGDPRPVQATVLAAHFLAGEGGPGAHFLKGIGNATQIIHLAAAALGLGSQWVSLNRLSEARLMDLLDVPDELTIHTIIPIGYPAYEPAPPYRRELKEIMHLEKYDRAKFRSGSDVHNFLLELRQRTKPSYKPAYNP